MTLRILGRPAGQVLQGVKNAKLAIMRQRCKRRAHVAETWSSFISHGFFDAVSGTDFM